MPRLNVMKTNQKSNSKKLNQLPLGNVPFFVSAITIQKFYVSLLKIELRCYIKAVSQKQIFREVKKHPEKNKTDKLISLFFLQNRTMEEESYDPARQGTNNYRIICHQ